VWVGFGLVSSPREHARERVELALIAEAASLRGRVERKLPAGKVPCDGRLVVDESRR
jgi:hypothetical protein